MKISSGNNLLGNTTGTVTFSGMWSEPTRMQIIENSDSLEIIYKQTSLLNLSVYPSIPPEQRVFKIVYSCVDGKWNKSDPIYGKIIEEQSEYYEF